MSEKAQLLPQSTKPRPGRSARVRPAHLLALLAFSIGSLYCYTIHSAWTVRALDPHERALRLLREQPIIDGHIDLPILARYVYANQVDSFDLRTATKGHVDIPRLRQGRVGGFFWSVFVPCPEDAGYPPDNEANFTTSTWRVRDTIEQIDVATLLINKYSDTFELVANANQFRRALHRGKIAAMLGVEGGHQLGSTLSTIRAYYTLGVRYITLSHTCHNALADSCGSQGNELASRWDGLSAFGHEAVREMNRLGMVVDVSHTSPKTASDALTVSEAPVIFSHSNARGQHDAVRNIPDAILRRIGRIESNKAFNLTHDGEKGRGWGSDSGEIDKPVKAGDTIIMLNFSPDFVSESPDGSGRRANASLVADHADYIARLAGHKHVGIGSDFDGILSTPEGLEDVSAYPNLIAELIRRGWTDEDVKGLAGANLLRVLDKVEATARHLRRTLPSTKVFEGRTDLVPHDDL
ncbi:dipeptidase [Sporobolomyces koalae]|uniref:dipeptidase n=1 Tax=Sporobolomyces koalae TaxID=500713 RepID=UPI003177C8AE